MRQLSDSDVLSLWENGIRHHPLDRAIMLLAAAFPGTPFEQIAEWPLGRRNQALARVHCDHFGTAIRGWTTCPDCAEKLEFEFDSAAVAATENSEAPAASSDWVVAGRGSFRLPTSRDLAAALNETDARSAATRIVESCRIIPSPDSEAPPALELQSSGTFGGDVAGQWSDEELEEIGDRMALADPLAETRLAMDCAKCGRGWEESFDIAAFLWAEIDARARRLLIEINALASAYGWSEAQILELSEVRRSRYLEMVQS